MHFSPGVLPGKNATCLYLRQVSRGVTMKQNAKNAGAARHNLSCTKSGDDAMKIDEAMGSAKAGTSNFNWTTEDN